MRCRLVFVFGGLLVACGSGGSETEEPVSSDTANEEPSFAMDIYPILATNCAGSGCHGEEPYGGGIGLAQPDVGEAAKVVEAQIDRVLVRTSTDSLFRMPPPELDGLTVEGLTAEELALIEAWWGGDFQP